MRNSGTILLSLLLAASMQPGLHAADSRSDTIQKVFSAHSGGRLILDVDQGELSVSGGEGSEVTVEVIRKVEGGSDAKAADLLQAHEVTFSEDAQSLRVEARSPGQRSWTLRGPRLQVSVRVQVPREFNVDAKTSGGGVRIQRLKGSVNARTSGGSLHFEELEGVLLGRTSGGSVKGARLKGPVDVGTSGGSIQLEDVTDGSLKANTAGGSIRLLGIHSPVEAKTSGGSIHVECAGTPIRATTSGGSVEAVLSAPPTGDIELRTSAGGIGLTLPEASRFTLDASTSAGSVRSEFNEPGANKPSSSSLQGPVHGGGVAVKLRTSAGSIRIRKS